MNEPAVTISTRALRRTGVIVLAVAVLAALGIVGWQLRDRVDLGGVLARGAGDQIDRTTYQAVFLTGGQVYFGKLATHGDDYFLLRDVFYLQPSGTESPTPQQPGQLIKRGRELHGPQDEMIIPKGAVLFIENLRADGDVMTAIRGYNAGSLPPATPAPIPATSAPSARPSASPTR